MGITGLLPFLEKSSKKTNINQFTGGTVAIDSYCWLHKGAFSCADKLSRGQQTDAYVHYCMKFIYMLLSHKIKPILVFDGRYLPAKAHTEAKRREARESNRRKAIELMQIGQHAEARNLLRRSIDITHEMALELIKQCQKMNIDCIVAPYEADAQLAYLNITGIADVVITEDSDLTLFGCKKVFFKMDVNGNGILVDHDRLHLAMGVSSEHFSMENFRNMCILSGCDYLPSLPGIGLNKAKKFITLNTDCDIHRALANLGSYLNMKSIVVTKEYRDSFILAIITFKHQLVFCPLQRKQVRLNPPEPDVTEEQLYYAGVETGSDIALQLAFGNCDPFTLKVLHNFDPNSIEFENNKDNTWRTKATYPQHISMWSKEYRLKQNELEVQKESPEKMMTWPNTSGKKTVLCTNRLKGTILMKEENDTDCQELNQKEILNMYKYKSTDHTQNNSKLDISLPSEEEVVSPVLIRRANPFSKQESNNKVSPSLLSKGKSGIKRKNIMRARRTIIDEANITESEFFATSTNKNDERTLTDNNILRPSTNTHKIVSENMESKLTNETEMESYPMDVDDKMHTVSFTPNECTASENLNVSNSCDSGKSYEDVDMIETVSNKTSINEDPSLSNLLTPPELRTESDFLIQQEDVYTENSRFFLQSNSKLSENKSKTKKRSGSGRLSAFRHLNVSDNESNSSRLIKRVPSTQRQQSLLSMYGFEKKSK